MFDKIIGYLTSAHFFISLIIVAVTVILWFLIGSVAKRIYKRCEDNQNDIKRLSFVKYAIKAIRLLMLIVAGLTVLQIHGINVGSMLAGLGIASAVGGLALQDIFKDVIMGVRLISDKFFMIGDIVRYGDTEGVVDDFNVRVTRIKNLANGDYMTICNRNISEISIVSNWTDIDIGLSYSEDPQKVHAVLGKIAATISDFDDVEDCIYKGTDRFESSAVIYKLRLFCPADKRFDIRRKATMTIQEELKNQGIAIPYDQLDVNLKQNSN
ncbi:MAG: mechanosensitive ion channel family protein [Ruminococcus sp.]